jgi:hypothetical protein
MKSIYTAAVALMMVSSSAMAWDVTFVRNAVQGLRTSGNFNLVVTLQQQQNGDTTGAIGRCNINWNDADNACTIANIPSTTNALVNVFQRTSTSGMQDSVIGKISFWSDATVHVPTGVAQFVSDKTWSELNSLGGINIAILPQANVEIGDNLSNRPNGGTTFYGLNLGNCGTKDLSTDASGGSSICTMDILTGCYSPVFARQAGNPNKAKIWVNMGDAVGADHALCIPDSTTPVSYTIKVQ